MTVLRSSGQGCYTTSVSHDMEKQWRSSRLELIRVKEISYR